MPASIAVVRVLRWRWTPCAALVFGSLAFVGLATALVPERLGTSTSRSSAPFGSRILDRSRSDVLGPSDRTNGTSVDAPPSPPAAASIRRPGVQSFFRTTQELPPPLEDPPSPPEVPAAPTPTIQPVAPPPIPLPAGEPGPVLGSAPMPSAAAAADP